MALQFTSGVSAVEVYATVSDTRGEPVAGLKASDFRVEEDGTPQSISTFAAGEFPLAVAIGVDRSFSVTPERLAAANGGALVRPAVAPGRSGHGDRRRQRGRDSRPAVGQPRRRRRGARPACAVGTTPLHDATLAALDVIQAASGRRALILLSDGEDRYSRTSSDALVAEARRRDVLVYPVATGRKRPELFAELASVTGGRTFHAADRRDLETALGAIARELRLQYLLGYTPASDQRRGWRSIRVTVARPEMRVRAREGYYVK
jgi:hypothetical protein